MIKNLRIYKKLGIVLMSAIMLGSVAPSASTLTANASQKHRSYHQTLLIKKRKMTKNHYNSSRKLHIMKQQLSTLRKRIKHNKGKKRIAIKKQLSRKQKSYNTLIHRNRYQLWLIGEYQKALNHLQNEYNYNRTSLKNLISFNNSLQDRLDKMRTMHIQDYGQIRSLLHKQIKDQNQIQKIESKTYHPSNVPKIVTFANNAIQMNKKVAVLGRMQPKVSNKAIVKKITTKENKNNAQQKRRIEGQEKDHELANTNYIKRLEHQNTVINYGLSVHNGYTYNQSIQQLKDIQAFNHTTALGRKLQRQANRRAKSIERVIGSRVKKHDTNQHDKYVDGLLNAWADNNNSEAQYYESHVSIKEVLNGIHNKQKRKAIWKEYQNVQAHKKSYNTYRKLYNNRHQKYHFHISKRGARKYSTAIDEYEKLRATKQTRQVKAKERILYKQAQADKSQQISAIQGQIKILTQEITQQQHQYNQTKEKWQDAEGDIPLRTKLHKQMDAIANNIKQLQAQIESLEGQSAQIVDDMNNDSQEQKKQKYYHSLLGNVKTIQHISHPNYVRISAPTYYFDNFDITNKANQDIKVAPNTPKNNIQHKVNAGYMVTLSDGTKYIMYNIDSNEGGNGEAYNYLILARYTTPVVHQKFRWNLHYIPLNKFGRVKSRTPYYTSAKYHGKQGGMVDALQALHLEGVYYQGNDKNDKILYKAITQQGKLFGKTKYGHTIMYIPGNDVNESTYHKPGHNDVPSFW